MQRLEIHSHKPAYLGAILIATGIVFRRLVEITLVPDARLESGIYLAIIFAVQFLAVACGIFLLVKQPSLHTVTPSKAELALVCFSLTLSFSLLEIGARFWLSTFATPEQHDRYVLYTSVKQEALAFIPHHYLGYYPNPGYRKGETFHNSLGYRDNEFPLEKANGVYRIVALGGSSTYDVRIEDNDKTFTGQLERLLQEEYGYEHVEVVNAGVPGYNSWEILINLEFRVLDLDPDLVIIYEGTNDVHARLVDPAAYRGDDSGRRQPWQVPPVAFWEHSALLRILSRTANLTRQVSVDDFVAAPTYMSWPYEFRLADYGAGVSELLNMNPPIYFHRNLENMVAVAEQHDVDVLLATWAFSPHLGDYASDEGYQRGFVENNHVVRDVAESQDVLFFDFAEVMSQDRQYWADGRHSNEAGALLKATLFAGYIDAKALITR